MSQGGEVLNDDEEIDNHSMLHDHGQNINSDPSETLIEHDLQNEIFSNPIRMTLTKTPKGIYEIVHHSNDSKKEQDITCSTHSNITKLTNTKMDVNLLYSDSDESSDDECTGELEIDIKCESINEKEKLVQSISKNTEKITKWWQKVPKHLYTNRGLGGTKIFLPSDLEEFVNRVSKNQELQKSYKKELDLKMIEVETGEAKFLQFSDERDKPILEKYKTFVHQFSAKDALNIFSEDYDILDIPTGLTTSGILICIMFCMA